MKYEITQLKKYSVQPTAFIDGRYARTLRGLLGLPTEAKDLTEESEATRTSLGIKTVQETLHLPALKYLDLAGKDAFLCGGALTAWVCQYPTSDYDFFFPDLEAAQRFHEKLIGLDFKPDGYQGDPEMQTVYEGFARGEYTVTQLMECAETPDSLRALNYSKGLPGKFDWVQIVILIRGKTPVEVINTFDFTVSMLGTDGRALYFNKFTWTDLMRKRLRVHHIHHGISTMRRMIKYSKRGFYACVGTMRAVAQGVIDSPTDQAISVD
jgi:hypothetical protein